MRQCWVCERSWLLPRQLSAWKPSWWRVEPNSPPRPWRVLSQIRKPAPLHGQHTEEVLRTLGYSDKQVQGLLAEGVVKATRLPA